MIQRRLIRNKNFFEKQLKCFFNKLKQEEKRHFESEEKALLDKSQDRYLVAKALKEDCVYWQRILEEVFEKKY